jgi:hypothetical protein
MSFAHITITITLPVSSLNIVYRSVTHKFPSNLPKPYLHVYFLSRFSWLLIHQRTPCFYFFSFYPQFQLPLNRISATHLHKQESLFRNRPEPHAAQQTMHSATLLVTILQWAQVWPMPQCGKEVALWFQHMGPALLLSYWEAAWQCYAATTLYK